MPDTPPAPYLTRLPDGTVKQRNPFTGTEVWTVPGRGNRPLGMAHPEPQPLDPADHGRHCAFCEHRLLETPPEKARLVRRGTPAHDDGAPAWELLRHLPAERMEETTAEFRRISNRFEILSWDYWRLNHGVERPAHTRAHRDAYLASPAGRTHVLAVVGTKLRAAGRSAAEVEAMPEEERLAAADDHAPATSGTLTPEEHYQFLRFTADAARELYAAHPAVAYVSVFQNWLKPAGASFDHLHKQLVAIDERGAQNEAALARLAAEPNVFNDVAVNAALDAGLVIAANDHAVMFAGFGHRYPTVEVWSRSA